MKQEFEIICQKYIDAFCKKQEMFFDYWVADEIGIICQIGDYFFNFDDIRFDIDNDIPKGKIIDWYDEQLEKNYMVDYGELKSISYKNWLKL